MEGIVKKQGEKPGKTVAIIGGVHGNERIGVDAVRWARDAITPDAGTVYFIEANLPAIEKNVRQIYKNLNRCFLAGNAGAAAEDARAREIMGVLDECDASLDVHASNSKEATPFIICEAEGMPVAQTLDFGIVSSGWNAIEPGGTDGYMHETGKIGMCIECGSVYDAQTVLPLAQESIVRFLRFFGVCEGEAEKTKLAQRRVLVHTAVFKEDQPLSFAKEYADFEPLPAGEVFARQGGKQYAAAEGDCIIFPHLEAAIGAEAFILGREMVR